MFFGPRYWNLKRLLGTLNWYRGRRQDHQLPVLQALVADLLRQAPDHIAVTGDLVNIGLPAEHQRALQWLRQLGSPAQVSVVPGNHDIYTRLGRDEGALRWRDYMADNDGGAAFARAATAAAGASAVAAAGRADNFPYVQRLGKIAIIGINSAIPTRPFVAAGRVGAEQLHRLGGYLRALADAGLFRIVLIHHPPLPGQASPLRGLQDAEALQAILAEHGAELVLHGHNHSNMLAWCHRVSGSAACKGVDEDEQTSVGEGRAIAVVGAPSASMGRERHGETLARYNLYHITTQGSVGEVDGAARIEMVARGLARPGGEIVELERRLLVNPSR